MVLTEIGHVDIATNMKNYTYWLAWGAVPEPWDAPPVENLELTQLEQEVGRVKEAFKEFVKPDENGAIEVNNQSWTISTEPTKFIYLKFIFEPEYNSNDTIYQLGLFSNTVPSAGNEDKIYLLPSEISDTGKLMFIENIMVINRNDATKNIFEYIIAF